MRIFYVLESHFYVGCDVTFNTFAVALGADGCVCVCRMPFACVVPLARVDRVCSAFQDALVARRVQVYSKQFGVAAAHAHTPLIFTTHNNRITTNIRQTVRARCVCVCAHVRSTESSIHPF